MSLNTGMMSSERPDWATPQWLFDRLDAVFHFQLDAAASAENTKCGLFLDDCLNVPWSSRSVYLNPPYGRGIGAFVRKARDEWDSHCTTVICLLPARTDTTWWQDCWGAKYILFLKGRLKFDDGPMPAPFPSAVVMFTDKDVSLGTFADIGTLR